MSHTGDGHDGCGEYRALTRRQFLRTGGVAAIAVPTLPAWMPRVAFAQSAASDRDILISVFLRGGADGLTLCVPFGDPHYYQARATLAIPQPDAASPHRSSALDDFFAFPPAMTPLLSAYRARNLLVVHAAGQFHDSRSHFDAQRYMEVGRAGEGGAVTGWLARHLASVEPRRPSAPLRGLGLPPGLRKTLIGAPKTLPLTPTAADIGGDPATLAERVEFLRSVYSDEPNVLRARALDALAASPLVSAVDIKGYRPANDAVYPDEPFAQNLRAVAALINADIGLEAAHLDLDGWDTHASQDPFAGTMFGLMSTLSKALAAFHDDIVADSKHRVTLVAMSEFGRTVKENGSGGSDHGRATAMLVMGQGIAGGRVLVSRWPGLAPENLADGQDLQVTLDYRDILAEVIAKRLGNPNLAAVFPDLTPKLWGVTRPI